MATRRITAATAVLIIVAGLAAGCATKKPTTTAAPSPAQTGATAQAPSSSPSPAGEPRTYEAAKAAVDRVEEAGRRADGGALWDLLTSVGQATMSRDDFIKVTTACAALAGSGDVLSVALDAGGSTATVTQSIPASQGGGTYTWRVVYEAGKWKHQPSDSAMSWMGLGADKAIANLRDSGVC